MKKVLIIIFVILVCWGALIMSWPFLYQSMVAANATANITSYEGAQDTVVAAPLVLWFIPPALGIGAIIWGLKKRKD